MLTGIGSLICGGLDDQDADQGRRVLGSRDRPRPSNLFSGPRRCGSPDARPPGRCAAISRAQVAVVRTRLPSTLDDHSVGSSPALAAGEPGARPRSARRGAAPRPCSRAASARPRLRSAARSPSHAGPPAAPAVAGPRRVDLVGLDQRLSLVDEVEQLLEQLGPPDDDGVVVHAAGPVGSFPPWTLTSGATGFALSGRNT